MNDALYIFLVGVAILDTDRHLIISCLSDTTVVQLPCTSYAQPTLYAIYCHQN